jgi:ferredoxin-NADP reductase
VPVASAPAAPKLDPPGPATPAPDTKSSIAKTPADEASKHWKGKLKVASIYIETPLVKTFRFANPTGEDLPFTYEAGQFLTLGVTVDGKPVKRSYSIGSHPCQHDAIELTIKREDHGLVSRYMHDVVREGDLLNVDTAYGNLIFSDLGDRPIVLIGGGVGITPLMAVIRCMISCGMKNSIHLFYGCKSLSDFVFRDELEYLQKRNPNLKLTIGVHTLVGSFPGAYQGRINQEHIEKDVPDIAHSRVHLCGPPPLMLAMQKILEDLHVPKDQIKTEAFGPSAAPAASAPAASAPAASAPAASAPAASAPAASAPAASAPAASAPAASAPAAQAGTTVVFKKSGQTLSIAPDQTVLELSEQYGINIPFVCRVGTCGACKVPLLSGQVDMEVQVALTDEDKQKGIILACQAKAKSNLEIQDP